MRIFTRIVYDLSTGKVLESESYEYSGPVALCRGDVGHYNRAQTEKAQLGTAYAPGYQQAATAERGYLLPQYQDIAAHPVSEAEKAARTSSLLGGIGSAYGAASENASNRLARTRNTAGYSELLDELSRERGRTTSEAESKLGADLGDTAFRRRMAALQGTQGIYGVDTSTLAHLLSTGGPPLPQKSIWDSLISAGASLGTAALGA